MHEISLKTLFWFILTDLCHWWKRKTGLCAPRPTGQLPSSQLMTFFRHVCLAKKFQTNRWQHFYATLFTVTGNIGAGLSFFFCCFWKKVITAFWHFLTNNDCFRFLCTNNSTRRKHVGSSTPLLYKHTTCDVICDVIREHRCRINGRKW